MGASPGALGPIGVALSVRGKGLGLALLRLCVQELAGRGVRRPQATLAVVDHNVSTQDRRAGIKDPTSRLQVETLEANCREPAFRVPYIPLLDPRQGIVHIIGPEQGFTLPGATLVCGDSHTSTHGAFGALAFGIGTSEVEHVLATQTLVQKRARNFRIRCEGALPKGVGAKDLILHIIGRIGTAGGTGCARGTRQANEALGTGRTGCPGDAAGGPRQPRIRRRARGRGNCSWPAGCP